MRAKNKKPLEAFRDNVNNITSKFIRNDPVTIDPETGVMYMPEGAARLYYYAPDQNVHLIFSKDAHNLSDQPKAEKMRHCYHVASYSLETFPNWQPGTDQNIFNNCFNTTAIQQKLTTDFVNFVTKYKSNMSKHFTLDEQRLSDQPPELKKAGINIDSETYTSVTHEYLTTIDKQKDGYAVNASVTCERVNDEFVPVYLLNKGLLSRLFKKNSGKLGKAKTLDEAMQIVDKFWNRASSTMWEEKSAFSVLDKKFRLKSEFKLAVNEAIKHPFEHIFKIAATAAIMAAIFPDKYEHSYLPALTFGIVHAGIEFFTGRAYKGGELLKKSKLKQINEYGCNENSTAYYRLENKHCAHIDQTRLIPNQMSRINHDNLNLGGNGTIIGPYKMAGTLEELTTCMHQRGISSRRHLYNDNMVVNFFQNGVVRIQHYDPTTKIYSVYAQYRPELCKNKNVALPKFYADQFKDDKVMAFTYTTHANTFAEDIQKPTRYIDPQHAVKEIYRKFNMKTLNRKPEVARELSQKLGQIFFVRNDESAATIPAPLSDDILRSLDTYIDNEAEARREKRLARLLKEDAHRAAANDHCCISTDQIDKFERAYLRSFE